MVFSSALIVPRLTIALALTPPFHLSCGVVKPPPDFTTPRLYFLASGQSGGFLNTHNYPLST
jgi:hypothetical protein